MAVLWLGAFSLSFMNALDLASQVRETATVASHGTLDKATGMLAQAANRK